MSNISKAASKFGKTVGLTGAPVFIKSDNVIDLIINDHNEAKELYEKYKKTNEKNVKKNICNSLIKKLVQHDEVEQLLVYPLLREKIGGKIGEDHYERSLSEHQEHRNLLYKVKQSNINNDLDFDKKLEDAMKSVFYHVKKEESEVLPLLKENISENDLKRIGSSFKAHKLTAVTRPHPDAPTQGFPAAVANIITKPFDLLKDFKE
jgi:hemerythrin superfamily protein